MHSLRRIALRTPLIKEIALRRLSAPDLREAIEQGEIPGDKLHAFATAAAARPTSAIRTGAETPLPAAEFANLAIRSGRLNLRDRALLTIVGLRHWDMDVSEDAYRSVARAYPEVMPEMVRSGKTEALAAVRRLSTEPGLLADQARSALAAVAVSAPPEARVTSASRQGR